MCSFVIHALKVHISVCFPEFRFNFVLFFSREKAFFFSPCSDMWFRNNREQRNWCEISKHRVSSVAYLREREKSESVFIFLLDLSLVAYIPHAWHTHSIIVRRIINKGKSAFVSRDNCPIITLQIRENRFWLFRLSRRMCEFDIDANIWTDLLCCCCCCSCLD